MTGAMAAFWTAAAGASLICYALMTRLQNRRRKRRSSGDGAATDGSNYGDGGWNLANWFGSGHHSAIDSSGNPIDFGGGDGGGGDSGAGDGGGDSGGGGGAD